MSYIHITFEPLTEMCQESSRWFLHYLVYFIHFIYLHVIHPRGLGVRITNFWKKKWSCFSDIAYLVQYVHTHHCQAKLYYGCFVEETACILFVSWHSLRLWRRLRSSHECTEETACIMNVTRLPPFLLGGDLVAFGMFHDCLQKKLFSLVIFHLDFNCQFRLDLRQ